MSNEEDKTQPKRYELNNETVIKIVAHSVGVIANDCGYQLAHQASLDILTDLCCDYIKKISTQLRFSEETQDWRDSNSDFVNSLERVFHQLNVPSAANLHQFISKIDAIKKYKQSKLQNPQSNNNNNNNNQPPNSNNPDNNDNTNE